MFPMHFMRQKAHTTKKLNAFTHQSMNNSSQLSCIQYSNTQPLHTHIERAQS